MRYDIIYRDRRGFLHIARVSGPDALPAAQAVWDSVDATYIMVSKRPE